MDEWLVFETGPETKRLQGAVLGLQFETNYASLHRIRVECDLVTADLNDGTPSLYVFHRSDNVYCSSVLTMLCDDGLHGATSVPPP